MLLLLRRCGDLGGAEVMRWLVLKPCVSLVTSVRWKFQGLTRQVQGAPYVPRMCKQLTALEFYFVGLFDPRVGCRA